MADRKQDHIRLNLESQTPGETLDKRFDYEPMGSAHPGEWPPFEFLGKQLRIPIWVSSMTGGTKKARHINRNLARACREFGMGMALGSCRSLLGKNADLGDFNVRSVIGDALPLYANLGIAQVEKLLDRKGRERMKNLLGQLRADGLVVHVNPLQECFQEEGDRINRQPIEVIAELLDEFDHPVIVKEVGQGMGPESLKALLKLPLAAIEFAAFGGANFTRLELLRRDLEPEMSLTPFAYVGHDAEEMTGLVNRIVAEETDIKCRQLIISGGIESFLDGYYLIGLSSIPAIYGQGSSFLKYAGKEYTLLQEFVNNQVEGLKLARAYLRLKKDHANSDL